MATNRNRVIYQSEALFTKKIDQQASIGQADQLLRVQDISHGVELNRVDVNEFGQLAAIERKIIEPPTVSLDFSYYIHGGRNEKLLGLNNSTSREDNTTGLVQALSGWLIKDPGQNYFISVVDEGLDNEPSAAGSHAGVIGIGNGYVTSYNVEAAVGDIPSSSISIEANNLVFQPSGKNIMNPAVDLESGALKYPHTANNSDTTNNKADFPRADDTGSTAAGHSVTCLRPGDITINFNDAGNCKPKDSTSLTSSEVQMGGAIVEGTGACHVQNFTLDVPVARTPLTRIGSTFPYSREVDVPLNITLSVSALMGDMDEGSLNSLLCGDDKKRNIRIAMRTPCAEDGKGTNEVVMEYLVKGAQLDSQNFSASIGDNKTVDMVFTAQLAGANGSSSGLFIWTDAELDDYAIGTNPIVYGQET
jgi:hypothetical protein